MKKTVNNLLLRLVILSSIIIFFSLCYLRRIKNKTNNIFGSFDFTLIDDKMFGNKKDKIQYWTPSDILDPLPYLDIGPLEELVERSGRKGPTFISDLNINNILNGVEEENKKWNISSLTNDQIKHITRPKEQQANIKSSKLKYILFWNGAYGSTKYGFCCGTQPFSVCPVKDCFVTDNRTLFNNVDQFDVIQFHQRTMSSNDLPQNRSRHQRYVMWYMESADYPLGFVSSQYDNFFNWTITYRRDADFRNQYGVIKRVKEPPSDGEILNSHINKFGIHNAALSQNKTKKIAWFVSHCNTKSEREKYVEQLQKYIQVDIFGQCGTLSCPKKDAKVCWDQMEEEYFFYLAFENSLCKDYITEKFFNPIQRNIIPVVLGGALDGKIISSDYVNGLNAPYHSFIDARQFQSPKLLANYLNTLYASPHLYAEYFWWKKYYQVSFNPVQATTKTYCDLCKRLHDEPGDERTYHKVIENLQAFWDDKSRCQRVKL